MARVLATRPHVHLCAIGVFGDHLFILNSPASPILFRCRRGLFYFILFIQLTILQVYMHLASPSGLCFHFFFSHYCCFCFVFSLVFAF